ncbi:MAG TPA: cytidylate kinase-like family protein [Verrucomicrobiae bacterium]|nr:cytidylate kinase-like family protein [Verrucomicrobiae bacterium]
MITTLKLVEKQLAMCGIQNRLQEVVKQPGRYITKDGVAFGPCLLISRECGSGTGHLAQKVVEALGWNVFDSRIVDEIAKAAHVQQRLVQSVDERVHSLWEQTWRDFLLDDFPDKKYLHHLREVVMTLGHFGSVVLVGRGAQYFLPPQCALRVRVVAPLDWRVRQIAEHDKLSVTEASAKAIEVDSCRAMFVWKTFKKDIASPLNHDLVINTADLSVETAVQLVLAALEGKLGVRAQKHLKQTVPAPAMMMRAD